MGGLGDFGLETKFGGMFVAASPADVFRSAGVTVWSPGMDAVLELELADLLLSFYHVSQSTVHQSLAEGHKNVACTRAGAHNVE